MCRQPRRAYDKDGREILPATMANIRRSGVIRLRRAARSAGTGDRRHHWCAGRGAVPALLGLRIARIRTAMNMAEYYAALRASTGWQLP
jgi:hypothetical protein